MSTTTTTDPAVPTRAAGSFPYASPVPIHCRSPHRPASPASTSAVIDVRERPPHAAELVAAAPAPKCRPTWGNIAESLALRGLVSYNSYVTTRGYLTEGTT